MLDAPFDHLMVLLMGERRALAGGADRNEPVGSFRQLPVDQSAIRALVEVAVLEGGHKRGEGALEARPGCHDTVLGWGGRLPGHQMIIGSPRRKKGPARSFGKRVASCPGFAAVAGDCLAIGAG